MPIPVFPPELHDTIIDHLWDDPIALIACSLTCRSWVPTTRVHLFYSVELLSVDDCDRFEALLDSSVYPNGVADYCQKLSIFGGEFRNGRFNFVSTCAQFISRVQSHFSRRLQILNSGDGWIHNRLPRILTKLHRLAALNMICVRWHNLSAMLMYSASSTIAVHALHLTHVFFAESNDFFRLVAAFPRLTDLSLTAVYWTRLSSQPSSSISLPWGNNSVVLRKLDVSTDFTSTVLEWLTRSSFKLRPHFLFLKWTHKPKDNAVLRYILREAGTSLRTLRLCGEYDTFRGQMISSTSSTADSLLSCNTQLRALFLYHALCDFTKLSGDVTSTSALPWISFVLSRLNSTSLRQLDIIFTTDTVVDRIVTWGWAELDDVLSHLVTKVPELIVSIYLESFLGDRLFHAQEAFKLIKASLRRTRMRLRTRRGHLHLKCRVYKEERVPEDEPYATEIL